MGIETTQREGLPRTAVVSSRRAARRTVQRNSQARRRTETVGQIQGKAEKGEP